MDRDSFFKRIELELTRSMRKDIEGFGLGYSKLRDSLFDVKRVIEGWVRENEDESIDVRFISYEEYLEVFKVGVMKQLEVGLVNFERDKEREKEKREREILRERAKEGKEGLGLFEELRTVLFGGVNFKEVYDDFFERHPGYDYFDIRSEGERVKYMNVLDKSFLGYLDVAMSGHAKLSSYLDDWREVMIEEKQRNMHTYIVGGTGSGKSELMKTLIYQDIQLGDRSVIVIDPNGDLAKQVAKLDISFQNRERIVYVDASLDDVYLPVINPFDLRDKTDYKIDIMKQNLAELVNLVCKDEASELSSHMRVLITRIIYVLLKREGSSFRDMIRFLDKSRNKDLLDYALGDDDEDCVNFFTTTFNSGIYQKVKESLQSRFELLIADLFFKRMMIGKSKIDIQDCMDNNKILIINLSKGEIGRNTANAVGKILIGIIQGFALSRSRVESQDRNPCHLYIDEFQNFVSESIDEILRESRKYKLYLTLASQIVGQGMKGEFLRSILANTRIKIVGKSLDDISQKIIKAETGASDYQLRDATLGRFFVAIKDKDTKLEDNSLFMLTGSKKKIDYSCSMQDHEWFDMVEEIKAKYYTKKDAKYVEPKVKRPKYDD